MVYEIRAAHQEDLIYLPAIEDSAGKLFATDLDLAWLARAESTSVKQHQGLLQAWNEKTGFEGGTWVAVYKGDDTNSEELVGFISTSIEGGHEKPEASHDALIELKGPLCGHIHELSVHESHQRRGLAKALIHAVKEFGLSVGMSGLTLTTMRDLAWNRPFYARQGFLEVDANDLQTSLGIWASELWQEDQIRFEKIKSRRCFMVCKM